MKMMYLETPNGKLNLFNVIAFYYHDGYLFVRFHQDGSNQNRQSVTNNAENRAKLAVVPNETAEDQMDTYRLSN